MTSTDSHFDGKGETIKILFSMRNRIKLKCAYDAEITYHNVTRNNLSSITIRDFTIYLSRAFFSLNMILKWPKGIKFIDAIIFSNELIMPSPVELRQALRRRLDPLESFSQLQRNRSPPSCDREPTLDGSVKCDGKKNIRHRVREAGDKGVSCRRPGRFRSDVFPQAWQKLRGESTGFVDSLSRQGDRRATFLISSDVNEGRTKKRGPTEVIKPDKGLHSDARSIPCGVAPVFRVHRDSMPKGVFFEGRIFGFPRDWILSFR